MLRKKTHDIKEEFFLWLSYCTEKRALLFLYKTKKNRMRDTKLHSFQETIKMPQIIFSGRFGDE